MVKWQLSVLSILMLSIAVISFSSVDAWAAPAQVLTISPADVNTVLQPSSVNNGSFEVIDQGKTGYSFQVYATPYNVKGEDYEPGFSYLPGAPNVASWFHFSTTKASIAAGQASLINYSITVPANTPAGGYYAVAFAQTEFPKAANAVTVNERAGVIFYLEVAGPVVEKGQLLSWQVKFLQTPPLSASIRLNNTGSIHYFTNIHLNVRDILGNLKYSVGTQKALLPQTVRLVTLSWKDSPGIGLFKVNGTASVFNKTMSLPTRYVLVMSPVIQILLVLIVAALVIASVGRYILRRRRTHKIIKEEPK